MLRRVVVCISCSFLLLCAIGATQETDARVEKLLDEGQKAFGEGQYDVAGVLFEKAHGLAPRRADILEILAYSYWMRWDPAHTSETPEILNGLRTALQGILELEPSNPNALCALGSVEFNTRNFEEAVPLFKRHAAVSKTDTFGHYMMGVVRWAQAFQVASELRAKDGIPHNARLPERLRREFKKLAAHRVEEGFAVLQRVLVIDPKDHEALAYLNLLYRLKADLAESEKERKESLSKADELVEQTMKLRAAAPNEEREPETYLEVLCIRAPAPPPPPPNPSQADTVKQIP